MSQLALREREKSESVRRESWDSCQMISLRLYFFLIHIISQSAMHTQEMALALAFFLRERIWNYLSFNLTLRESILSRGMPITPKGMERVINSGVHSRSGINIFENIQDILLSNSPAIMQLQEKVIILTADLTHK